MSYLIFLIALVICQAMANNSNVDLNTMTYDRGYTLSQVFNLIRHDCGEVCDTSIAGVRGKYFDYIEKDIDCDRLFNKDSILDPASPFDSPLHSNQLPEKVKKEYLYQGRISMRSIYFDDSNGAANDITWYNEDIEKIRSKFRTTGRTWTMYGEDLSVNISRHIKSHMESQVQDGHVLVIGSQEPWLEALLLELGAKHVTTLEYAKIHCDYPNISTITPQELLDQIENDGQYPSFDAVVSFSSIEHSGLGRYGEGLNPWGDLIASARALCLTKPNGRMLIGIPVLFDSVLFNGCKLYGPLQLSHLFANWKQIHTEAKTFSEDTPTEEWPEKVIFGYQPLFVLEKSENYHGEDFESKEEL